MEELLNPIVQPWYESLSNPRDAQQKVFRRLIEGYRLTEYGLEHGAEKMVNIEDYQEFPITSYEDLRTYVGKVSQENYQALLPDKPVAWVMTRGTTGKSKIIPVTQKHVDEILLCGARAIVNYAIRKKDFQILGGAVLNLNFPSNVGAIPWSDGDVYGYSSGTYARLNPSLSEAVLVPQQEKIDALGFSVTRKGWEARFELVFKEARGEDVKTVIGVTPVMVSFANYVKKRHGMYPKALWCMHALFCTSVPKIHFKYGPVLKALYGNVDVVEMYTATEGAFGQQLDEFPYICPNYDTFLFEVLSGGKAKRMHEMKRGEWGRIVVSSSILPKYDIGDMVECMGKNYFRVFGRARWSTLAEHILYRALTKWFV